jgi:hypothetical protein
MDIINIGYHKTTTEKNVNLKYNEDLIIAELLEYIKSTYNEHYVGQKDKVQTFDVYDALGSLDTTSRDTAIKYLMRYGKKDGKNKKDLLKALHYTIILWYATQPKPDEVPLVITPSNVPVDSWKVRGFGTAQQTGEPLEIMNQKQTLADCGFENTEINFSVHAINESIQK